MCKLSTFSSQLCARHYPCCFTYDKQYILHDNAMKYYHPHFRDRETEAQRWEATCLHHAASRLQSWVAIDLLAAELCF